MKKWLMLLLIVTILWGLEGFAQACEGGDPGDPGICDTLYADCQDPFVGGSPPWQVNISLWITNDVVTDWIDSIAGMTIPLAPSHTNPAAYCSIPARLNNTNVYPWPDLDRSIFRHFGGKENYMMSLAEQGNGEEWDTRILDVYNNRFWFGMYPTGSADKRWKPGSQVLLATMTLLVEDTMTVCIDTTFTPMGRYVFARSDAITYMPRDNMPYCVSVQFSEHGDANGDGEVNVMDALYMLNYLFRQGPPPVSFEAGDANCDEDHGALDVVYLLNYLFRGGPPPGCP
jgi:hypothetical protein